jgi:hypothetical protein
MREDLGFFKAGKAGGRPGDGAKGQIKSAITAGYRDIGLLRTRASFGAAGDMKAAAQMRGKRARQWSGRHAGLRTKRGAGTGIDPQQWVGGTG